MVSESRSVNRANAADAVLSGVPPVQVTPPQSIAVDMSGAIAQGIAPVSVSPVEDGVEDAGAPVATKPLDREQARIVAAEIEQALNDRSSTVIKFNVSLVEEASNSAGSSSSFKFQVVERETGRVVRQFPPEDILNIRDRIKASPPRPGVFLDSLV